MKRIIVPCDFSSPSKEAFKLAQDIAEKTRGEVIVVHAIDIPIMYHPISDNQIPYSRDSLFRADIENRTREEFEKMNKEMGKEKVYTSLEIVYGVLLTVVRKLIKTKKADLVIMGTSGATGLEEIFIGSNTEKIVRHAHVPVLSIHVAPDINTIKNILLLTTLTLSHKGFMEKVKELQQFFNASLHLLYINTPANFKTDRQAKEDFEAFVKHHQLKDYFSHFRNYHYEEEGIIQFVLDEKIDLVVMATHGRKGLTHFLRGSLSEDVVNHTLFPVWTYRIDD